MATVRIMITRRVRLRAHSRGGMVAGGRRGGAAECAQGGRMGMRGTPGQRPAPRSSIGRWRLAVNRQVALGSQRSVSDGTFIVCGWIPFRARPREGESDPIDCRHRVWAKEGMQVLTTMLASAGPRMGQGGHATCRRDVQAAGPGGRAAGGRVRRRADAWRGTDLRSSDKLES